MDNNQLMAKTGEGNQSDTSSPQQSNSLSGAAIDSSAGVQPGTSTNMLTTNKSGVSLGGSSPTVVSIAPRTTATVQKVRLDKGSPSLVAIIVAVILFSLAAAVAVNIIKAGKKTT